MRIRIPSQRRRHVVEEEETFVSVSHLCSVLGIDDSTHGDPTTPAGGTQRGRAPDGVDLSGHARVLAVFDDFVLVTPLYVEYASTGR